MIAAPVVQQPIPVTVQSQLPVESIRADNQQVPPVPQPSQLFQSPAKRQVSAEKTTNSNINSTDSQNADAATGSAEAKIGNGKQSSDGNTGSKQSQSQSNSKAEDIQRQQAIQQEISQLSTIDRKVRAHETAHASVGGQLAGAPQFSYKKGPNGVLYAVAGEVSISTSEVPGDPKETLARLEQVIRAALAPAQPSPQDISVASNAASSAAQIRAELAISNNKQSNEGTSTNDGVKTTESNISKSGGLIAGKTFSQILADKLQNTGALDNSNTGTSLLLAKA